MTITKFDLKTLALDTGTYNITVRAKASGYADSPDSNPVLYSAISPRRLSGTWVFNSSIALTSMPNPSSFNFTDGEGVLYKNMAVNSSGNLIYYKTSDGSEVVARNASRWLEEKYRTISVVGDQAVTASFYQWFLTNAIKSGNIAFTIDGTTYQAQTGSTWSTWVTTSDNDLGLYVGSDGYVYALKNGTDLCGLYGSSRVKGSNAITSGQAYTLQ